LFFINVSISGDVRALTSSENRHWIEHTSKGKTARPQAGRPDWANFWAKFWAHFWANFRANFKVNFWANFWAMFLSDFGENFRVNFWANYWANFCPIFYSEKFSENFRIGLEC
jgi:hypothetical protein